MTQAGDRPTAKADDGAPERQRIGGWLVLDAAAGERVIRATAVQHPYFVFSDPSGRALVAKVGPGARLVLGRSKEADLPLHWDATVSTVHAVVERHLDLVTVEDLGPSTNGTYVNGSKVTARTRLADRDVLRCASTELLVRAPVIDAASGTVALPPSIDWSTLTPTERRVVLSLLELWPAEQRLQRAPSTQVLAEALGLGSETVRSHLKSIYVKVRPFGIEATREALAEAATGSEVDLLGG